MWNRELVVTGGWKNFGGMMWVGSVACGWVGCKVVVVVVGDQGGSMRESLEGCLQQEGDSSQGPAWPLANSAITPHLKQLAHNGHSGTLVL